MRSRRFRLAASVAVVLLVAFIAINYFINGKSASPALDISTSTSGSVTGEFGQQLTASKVENLRDGEFVTVSGSGYDEKIGIYLTYCVLPIEGERPEECGPFDITGKNNTSIWISSNPPVYGKLIATPFFAGGEFTGKLPVTRFIGDHDCAFEICAITTRADHTHGDVRTADLFIPVTFQE